MLVRDNADVTVGTLVDANGEVVSKPTVLLTHDEAKLLREYKKFLAKRGLREATYCNTCWQGNLEDGMDVFVRDDQILFKCRHRLLFYQGQSF